MKLIDGQTATLDHVLVEAQKALEEMEGVEHEVGELQKKHKQIEAEIAHVRSHVHKVIDWIYQLRDLVETMREQENGTDE